MLLPADDLKNTRLNLLIGDIVGFRPVGMDSGQLDCVLQSVW